MRQRFLLQILLLAHHVSGTIMPIIRSSRVLYSGCYLWYFVLWFSSCWSGVELSRIPHINDDVGQNQNKFTQIHLSLPNIKLPATTCYELGLLLGGFVGKVRVSNRERTWRKSGLNSSGSEQGGITGCLDDGNYHLGSRRCGEFLD